MVAEILNDCFCNVITNLSLPMEITSKGMTTTKNPLINLMTTIYFTNHQKAQLLEFLKKYPCVIYVKNALNVNFKSLHSNKIKSVCTLTLNFSK